MLPSERSERWVRRIGLMLLLLIALFIIVWIVSFIARNLHRALEQRILPEEGRAKMMEIVEA